MKLNLDYKLIFENQPECLMLLAPDGSLLDANSAGRMLLEADSRRQLRSHFSDSRFMDLAIGPEHRAAFDTLRSRVLGGDSAKAELELRGLKGGVRRVEFQARPVRNATGNVTSLLAVARELSGRPQPGEALQLAHGALRPLHRELRAISACHQVLLQAPDEQSLLNDVCRIVCEQAGYRLAWVGYAEHDPSKTVRPVAWAGKGNSYITQANLSWAETERGLGPAGVAIRTGEISHVPDVSTDPRTALWRENALQHGYRTIIGLPLKNEDAHVFGALLIYSAEANAVSPDEKRLLQELADDLAFGICTLRARGEHRRAEEKLRRKNRALRTISACNQALVRAADEAGLLNQICDICVETGGYRMAWVGYVDGAGQQTIRPVAHKIAGQNSFELADVLGPGSGPGLESAGAAIRTGQPAIVRNLPADPGLAPWRPGASSSGQVSYIALPLVADERTLGALNICSGEADALDAEEIDFLKELADDLAYGVEALRIRRERQQAMDALHESEELYRKLIAASPDAITVTDPAGQIRLVSAKALELFGVASERQALGRSILEWLAPAHRDKAAADLRQLAGSDQPLYREFAMKREDGSPFEAEVNMARIQSADGVARGAILITRDVTDRKRAAETLRKLSLAVEQSPVSIVITDTAGTIEYVNPKFTQVSGYSEAEVIGQTPRLLKSGEVLPQTYRRLWQTITAGKEWRGELHNRKKNGELFWESASISPVFNALGTITHFVAVKEDVTERKRLEEQFRQAQKMEAIGQLAGGVAHDFNNILAAMLLQLDLVENIERLPDPAREGLQQMRAAAERAATLTRQLLAFSRRQVMQPRLLDLNEVVTSLARMLRRVLGENVRLQLNLHPRPLQMRADAGMLDQMLMNLVINARDAMPGGGQVAIETSEKEFTETEARLIPDARLGRYASLRVTDTGTGIAPEVLPRIFEPFFTTKEAGKGTGLGLATVFGIAKQHGGMVTVQSQLGHGATFHVYLPASEEPETASDEPAPRPKPRGGTETILLVEDESSVRTLTRRLLERSGYSVLEAAHGAEALRVWQQHSGPVHLLLTDIVMPEGPGGFELAGLLQKSSPQLKVIFISGYSAEIAGRNLSLKAGQNFIHKPVAPAELLETVRSCLDGPAKEA